MEDVIQFTRNMDEFRHIMVVKLKLFEFEKVFNVSQVTSNQVIHCDNPHTFFNEPIAQVGTEKAGSTGDEDSFTHKKLNRVDTDAIVLIALCLHIPCIKNISSVENHLIF